MKLIADLHTHTIASTHAYNTVTELMHTAKAGGMQAMAITDHACGMPDAPHRWHFINLRGVPNWHGDFLLLKGVEANVMDDKGTLDMEEGLLQSLDWVIASMHNACLSSPMDATEAWLNVAQNPAVDMIGHPEQRQFPFEYDAVTKAFAQNNKVVELNGNSAVSRPGNEAQMRELALACKRNGTRVAVNSDAHSIYSMFNQQHLLDMLHDIDFPEELVINSSMDRLLEELDRHGKTMK